MRNGSNTTKKSKLSWSKSLVRKWFNIRSKAHDFHADDLAAIGRRGECILAISIDPYPWFTALIAGGGEDEWRGSSFTRREPSMVKKSKTVLLKQQSTGAVGHCIQVSRNCSVECLGMFLEQRTMALQGGWVSLVRRTLNNLPGTSGSGSFRTPSPVPDPVVEIDDDFEGLSSRQNNAPFFHRRSFQAGLSRSLRMEGDILAPQPRLERRYSVCDRAIYGRRPSDYENNYRWGGSSDDENNTGESPSTVYSPMSYGYGNTSSLEDGHRRAGHTRYCLVASKQMVGLFLMIWARKDIQDDIRNLKVSCVGRGLMGYLGNKGSISISMSLHQTSFCFVCSHLTSGQKEGDELRRNSDVLEILKKTRFPIVYGQYERSPETILEHDRIIWLGDLNYRIALSYRLVKALVEMRNWKALLEKDQLRIEQRGGRVFVGWNEGNIYFPPTYKYSNNSDKYAGDDMNQKEKKRTPAWFGHDLKEVTCCN
ncbi:hypothetical protein PR202_ga26977 [Eleusine coracana subsp. coracana]|uniref:Inositol polyphosphate-related phosphatase domain-containing protein n=1 Tax=Eleusine coracana subsp. coracana TaxID=191504 RepID=A0AAV5DFM7_ELECO|nr:hypothetical protein PR202_ga26977 [Eleusine coracana subsp. coracana]